MNKVKKNRIKKRVYDQQKKARNQVIIGAIIAIVVTILAVIFDEPIIVNFELNEVTKVEIKNSYFETTGVIINNFRDTVIFPDDKLTLKIALVNKFAKKIEYTPTIKILQGGKIIEGPFELESRVLAPNGGWTSYQKEFFVGGEGIKELEILFTGLDGETKEELVSTLFEKDLQVLSLNDKLQSDQNNTLLLGVIFSLIIGGGTVTALILNQKTSKAEVSQLEIQNENFLKKTSEQIRPWISVQDSDIQAKIEGNFVVVCLKNYGKTTAKNMKVIGYSKNKPFSKKELIKKGDKYKTTAMAPNEIWIEKIKLDPNTKLIFENSNLGHFGLHIKYNYEDKGIGITTIIGQWIHADNTFLYKLKELD